MVLVTSVNSLKYISIYDSLTGAHVTAKTTHACRKWIYERLTPFRYPLKLITVVVQKPSDNRLSSFLSF